MIDFIVDNLCLIQLSVVFIVIAASSIWTLVSFKKMDRECTCPKCGQVHYSTFCSNCGTRIEPEDVRCSGCNHVFKPSENYCPWCGTEIKR